MNIDYTAFQEPRGVMRILHFIFSICAFATVTGYSGQIHYKCLVSDGDTDNFSYPFFFVFSRNFSTKTQNCDITIVSPPSSDVIFFVTTGVLTMLFSLIIIAMYALYNATYKKDNRLPLLDFLLTVAIAVLWLSSSAAWANSLTGLKDVTNPNLSDNLQCAGCSVSSVNFSTLNISVIFGFLNFFLWAADLWFVYKETAWFQNTQTQSVTGV